LSIRGPDKAGDGTRAVYEVLERSGIVPVMEDDVLYWRIDKVAERIRSGELLAVVEERIGDLA